ncbi:hypothetical protein M404DRAFT_995075 [Pisolithus tinctorius Marx 270]|uniref:Uncharacterized protein n=1 Tax=Pisolithus tinctorius Marx 270 TaxID=870435 RepID=A0A0C3PQY6_PISTI|nr:hypothetical protein M404DRAFT_995075 [Pisolithus tinctorius Marx 270]
METRAAPPDPKLIAQRPTSAIRPYSLKENRENVSLLVSAEQRFSIPPSDLESMVLLFGQVLYLTP